MKNVTALAPIADADPIDTAVTHLRIGGLDAIEDVIAQTESLAGSVSEERIHAVLIEAMSLLLDTLERDIESEEAHKAIACFSPQLAATASNLLLMANFGGGEGKLQQLDDATVLCLIGLVAASGGRDEAIALLMEATAHRSAGAFRRAAYVARGHVLGIDTSLSALWTTPDTSNADLEAAHLIADDRPLDPAAHQQLGRRLAEHGLSEQALAAFSVGLALPIGANDKLALGEDLAILAAYLIARGDTELLDARRIKLALGACLPAAAKAEKLLSTRLAKSNAFQALDEVATAAAVRYFRNIAWHADAVGSTAYPMRNGKPYIDTVWLEITNHCNQKCTFCPDMFREDPRTWLPLDQVKRLIDELAETFTVGSMQLNAYGEPLVHPNIKEILSYIRERELPWPTFFTSHGMTLVDKKLAQLSHNYPAGIAISLHNDSQESYEATRSAKIGDYDTLVARVSALLRQMVNEGAASHLRLYQMVSNGNEDMQVDPKVRGAFPNTPERMMAHVRKWEAIAAEIAAQAPAWVEARAIVNSADYIATAFFAASHGDGYHLPVIEWRDLRGQRQTAFMSARPVGTYANLLLEYHPDWEVERKVVSKNTCSYFANVPSLAIFATGKLGICCLDMNSTAVFGSLDDFGTLRDALTSPEARRMFAQLSNGVATSRGCQICLGTGKQLCGSKGNSAAAATAGAA